MVELALTARKDDPGADCATISVESTVDGLVADGDEVGMVEVAPVVKNVDEDVMRSELDRNADVAGDAAEGSGVGSSADRVMIDGVGVGRSKPDSIAREPNLFASKPRTDRTLAVGDEVGMNIASLGESTGKLDEGGRLFTTVSESTVNGADIDRGAADGIKAVESDHDRGEVHFEVKHLALVSNGVRNVID